MELFFSKTQPTILVVKKDNGFFCRPLSNLSGGDKWPWDGNAQSLEPVEDWLIKVYKTCLGKHAWQTGQNRSQC